MKTMAAWAESETQHKMVLVFKKNEMRVGWFRETLADDTPQLSS